MLNMSKQFYNYLSDKLIKYLENNDIKSGERFYLQLDEKNQVEDFFNVLSENQNAQRFVYKHEQGGKYESISLNLKGVNLVIASTVNVTSGYLVTIRNASKEQKGVWENTALLIICDSPVDSIKGGCLDLRKDGMPFSTKKILGNLSKEIESSELSKTDKEIVKFYIKQKLDDFYSSSLWDYEEILSIIHKKIVDVSDYKKIGLFVDKSLEKETPKSMQKRLKENYDLYSKIDSYQEYEDKEQYLEKIFDDKGVEKLKKDNWRDNDFKFVKDSFEKNKANKALGYVENVEKVVDGNNVYWEKAKVDTVAGRRKRHIIVFNNSECDTLELRFHFDDTLSNEYIDVKSRSYAKVSGKKLIIRIPSIKEDSNFYKIVYNHKKESKSKYEFYIAVVNVKPEVLNNIKAHYEIKTGSGSKNRIQINSDGSEIKFGNGLNEKIIDVENTDDIVDVYEEDTIKISNSSQAWDDDSLKFKLNFDGAIVPFEIKEQSLRSKPIHSVNLLKLKREFKKDFTWKEDNKITQETREYYLDEKLKLILNKEKSIIEKGIMYGRESLNKIEKIDVSYSEDLTKAYNNILEYYKGKNSIPSLGYLDDELKELYEDYLNIYNKEIESIEERDIIYNNSYKKDLLKIGSILCEGKIMFTPFSPINIAYILELYKQLEGEVIGTNILERLSADNLLPYIYNKDEIYKPSYQKENIEWIMFEKKEKVSVGETNAFVAKVIREKIDQFINNFNYLFIKNSKAPVKVNIINIRNDKEVVRGIFDYIKKQIVNNPNDIIPVELNVFNNDSESYFDKFFGLTSIDKIEEEFNISFKTKNNQLDEVDVMRLALENIRYFKNQGDDYQYAHISFFKSIDDDYRAAEDNVNEMESGISIGGLLSAVTSNNNENDYRIGFGTKNIIDEKNNLIRTAINMNEFVTNCNNEGASPYRKGNSVVTRPLILKETIKKKLYTSSHWVTFIEPSFGLEYFKESENTDLIVIHYSDQYTSTEQYDTITVTNKSNQYINIIQEFLNKKDIKITDEKMNDVIRSFNSINGEWLLSLIANKSEYDREKLSIIAAIKYGLSLLNHEDIIWIPVSLEEILRVSNAVKLNKSEGIFTIKNLKKKGVHSDDIIFIGLNIKDKKDIKVYYYPVEVKIGYNFNAVIDKGMTQIEKTYELLKEQLSQDFDGERKVFKNKFFRNFFVKLLISNAQKLIINNIWPEKGLEQINEVKKYLLNDDYEVSFDLDKYIGKGALISFKKDNYWRSAKKEDDILVIELTEKDAYDGIAKTINELYEEFKSGDNDISLDSLLYSKNIDQSTVNIDVKDIIKQEEVVKVAVSGDKGILRNNIFKENENKECLASQNNINLKKSNSTRILLGEAEGTTKKIYWEYGNKELPNRHMVITGKSGNGKTYFIQCALKELIDAGVPAIIIDYTDGFKSSQLEPEFKEALGDRLKQFIVAANKFSLNIFKKGIKELDEDIYIDEDNVDVAERFKSVIGSVYKDLGIQQLNSIYQTVIRGLEKYDGNLNLRAFKNELEENPSSYAQTALAQLSVLLDKNPFDESQDFDWSDLHKDGGKLFIIQLTGYTKDVQKIITEMILWNLYMYKAQHGSKDKPFAVVLDEAQNLNFSDNSPSTKILTEGRKFGWSAWFATQFLKGQMDKATISRLQNSAQKIYFAQTEEEATSVANAFGETVEEKKAWARKLINLEKGTCISHGPIEDLDGRLTATKPTKIKITSLNNRIK